MEDKKKKVCFVIGSLSSGGAERVISTLSNELIHNFEVLIITFLKRDPFYFLHERVKVIACSDTVEQPSSVFQSVKLNYHLTKRVSRIMKEEAVDLAIGFITSANIIATIAAKINGIPSIISERNNPVLTDVPKFWVLFRDLVYPLADRVVLQTNGVRQIYKDRIKSHKLVILPNPIAPELTKLKDKSIKKEKIILSVGRLHKNKRHDMLIEAFNDIKQNDWKVLIVGDGNEKQRLNDLIGKYHLEDKIEIKSQVKHIHQYYNVASIFVFCSRTEGFPNALIEAMHYGLPTISTNCNFGPSDLIQDGSNGYLIGVDNKSELVEKLSLLMQDTTLQKQFSINAEQTAEDYVSSKVVMKWKQLITSLLN